MNKKPIIAIAIVVAAVGVTYWAYKKRVNSMDTINGKIRDAVDKLCKEVISAVYVMPDRSPPTQSLYLLFSRIANSWGSLCILLKSTNDTVALECRVNDCAAILRCMYEAYLQAAYIVSSPPNCNSRATLYLEYEHVERYTAAEEMVKQDNKTAKKVAESSLRKDGEARNKREFERVRPHYVGPTGKLRSSWYKINLRQMAKDVGREDEYVVFVKRYHSSIHSGPMSILYAPLMANSSMTEQFGLLIIGRCAKLLADRESIELTEESRELLVATDVDILDC